MKLNDYHIRFHQTARISKIFLIMRLTAFILFATFMQVSAGKKTPMF